MILKLVEYMLMILFWILPEMSLRQVKVLTWVYMVVFSVGLVVLLAQFGMRLASLGNKPEYFDERVKMFEVEACELKEIEEENGEVKELSRVDKKRSQIAPKTSPSDNNSNSDK